MYKTNANIFILHFYVRLSKKGDLSIGLFPTVHHPNLSYLSDEHDLLNWQHDFKHVLIKTTPAHVEAKTRESHNADGSYM